MPKYPKIKVELVGQDGNAFFIIGKVLNAMRRGKADPVDIEAFQTKAMSGDYDNVLRTVMEYVEITGPKDEDDEPDYEDRDEEICDTCGCKNCSPDDEDDEPDYEDRNEEI